ncbi:MAG: hypothetical protein J0J01_09210 [Reyranella sp.]|uniref:hypothetical protein n=1 Tax=Reyranella sp. TaxID=1929291 RepID=UPI001AC533F5|nr:hypothetical protein [Reyranella sp.]MBN9087073.1 hypothetical protein [Reyranella sp.]
MSLRLLIVAALATVLASCGGNLPNSAISRHLAGRYAGALTDSTAVATVIRDRGIRPPDLSSGVPVVEQLRAELAKSDPTGAYAGITYDLTRGNRLGGDWIVHTPDDMWGRKASDLPPGHSDSLVRLVHDLVASAQRRVDIALLQPSPDGPFLEALRSALQSLASRSRPITVRVILGQYPPDNVDVPAFLKALSEGIDTTRIDLSVAAFRSCVATEDCDSYSWNHAKIVAVDGREALVGGHNLWAKDYLHASPVGDLSMRLQGPAAASAVRYIDRLWQYVCANTGKKDPIALAGSSGRCPSPTPLPAIAGRDGVPILAVGRLGAGITKDFANQSDVARDMMLAAARHEIRIVQQDLGFGLGRADVLFPDSTIDRLIDFLRRGQGDIYIVLSNLGAKGRSGSTYSNDVTLQQLARHLRREVERRVEARDPLSRWEIRRGPDPVNALLCEHVHLAPYRFGPEASWPGGVPIANHAKFWMVDGRTFYIGSDNMYPVNLQEFGYIVDDPKAAREISAAYWTPLWQWSSKAAVSGSGVENCIFREVIK